MDAANADNPEIAEDIKSHKRHVRAGKEVMEGYKKLHFILSEARKSQNASAITLVQYDAEGQVINK